MALEHGSSSAKSAAELLLALQLGKPFEMQHLLNFDTRNRAHADVLMQHYAPFNINVARWLNDAGYDGTSIIEQLREKWAN